MNKSDKTFVTFACGCVVLGITGLAFTLVKSIAIKEKESQQ